MRPATHTESHRQVSSAACCGSRGAGCVPCRERGLLLAPPTVSTVQSDGPLCRLRRIEWAWWWAAAGSAVSPRARRIDRARWVDARFAVRAAPAAMEDRRAVGTGTGEGVHSCHRWLRPQHAWAMGVPRAGAGEPLPDHSRLPTPGKQLDQLDCTCCGGNARLPAPCGCRSQRPDEKRTQVPAPGPPPTLQPSPRAPRPTDCSQRGGRQPGARSFRLQSHRRARLNGGPPAVDGADHGKCDRTESEARRARLTPPALLPGQQLPRLAAKRR